MTNQIQPVAVKERVSLEIVVGVPEGTPAVVPVTPDGDTDVEVGNVHVLQVIRCANHHTPIVGGICTRSHMVCPIETLDIVVED